MHTSDFLLEAGDRGCFVWKNVGTFLWQNPKVAGGPSSVIYQDHALYKKFKRLWLVVVLSAWMTDYFLIYGRCNSYRSVTFLCVHIKVAAAACCVRDAVLANGLCPVSCRNFSLLRVSAKPATLAPKEQYHELNCGVFAGKLIRGRTSNHKYNSWFTLRGQDYLFIARLQFARKPKTGSFRIISFFLLVNLSRNSRTFYIKCPRVCMSGCRYETQCACQSHFLFNCGVTSFVKTDA